MPTAKAKYKVTDWNETEIDGGDGGAKTTRATVKGSFEGDLEGDGRSERVMWYRPDGTATYVALERIEGRLGDRSGTFVVRSIGEYDGTNAKANVTVIQRSGTAELTGVEGEGVFEAPPGHEGSLTPDYHFGEDEAP